MLATYHRRLNGRIFWNLHCFLDISLGTFIGAEKHGEGTINKKLIVYIAKLTTILFIKQIVK